jgi:eukaryotic-like serine/threonine-protein kinase
MIAVGPFELTGIIAEGGMGVVWSGRHRKQGVPVAVKVIGSKWAKQASQAELFAREARAMAALNHDRIIRVHDYGFISRAIEEASEGQLLSASPYIVMEYAPGGSLATRRTAGSWPELEAILMGILEALAHAHAHGFIHRDLKPGNVLLASPEGAQVKLTDFGIAQLRGRTDFSLTLEHTFSTAGTPGYMAPEQIHGHWRDHGPWTDLYALGCMAYELSTGQLPFVRPHALATLLAHLTDEVPPLTPRFSVPPGFVPWVERLLAKSPLERPRMAADAARELKSLGKGWDPQEHATASVSPERPTQAVVAVDGQAETMVKLDSTVLLTELARTVTELGDTGLFHRAISLDATRVMAPLPQAAEYAFPTSWHAPSRSPSVPLSGVGLGLFGARRIELVARAEERDILWDMLRAVHNERRPAAAVIRGGSGTGKTALAEWIARRAVEVGAAELLDAQFAPGGSDATVLAQMMLRFLQAEELTDDERRIHLDKRLRFFVPVPSELVDLDALVALTGAADGRAPDMAEAARWVPQMRKQIVEFLRVLAMSRPLVLWLDDLHWSAEAVELVTHLVKERDLPILIIATIGSEAAPQSSPVMEALRSGGARVIDLQPMTPREQRMLVRHLLPLAPEFVEEVATRTAGNPRFAVEILGDLVDRGALVWQGGSFRPEPGQRLVLPDSLHHTWAERLERVIAKLSARHEEARKAIELAACLGQVIERVEWEAACQLAGVGFTVELIELFAREGLIIGIGDGRKGAFRHEMLRESILRMAEDGGHLPEHHRLCLEVLDRLYAPADPLLIERRARHLVGAGRAEEVIDALIELANGYAHKRLQAATMRCAGLIRDGLDALGAGADDPRRIRFWVIEAWGHYQTYPEQSRPYIDQVLAHASLPRDSWAMAQISRLQAAIAQVRGELAEALELQKKARSYYEIGGDEDGIAMAYFDMGYVARLSGAHDDARKWLHIALEYYRRHQKESSLAVCLAYLAQVDIATGDYAAALTRLDEALIYARRVSPAVVLRVESDLAEVKRHMKDYVGAEALYRAAYEFHQDHGSRQSLVQAMNLGFTLIALERFEEALGLGLETIAGMKARDYTVYLGIAEVMTAAAAAGLGRIDLWEAHFPAGRRLLEDRPIPDKDVAWIAEQAGLLSRKAGWLEQAHEAFTLSLSVWRVLDRPEDIARLEGLLELRQSSP